MPPNFFKISFHLESTLRDIIIVVDLSQILLRLPRRPICRGFQICRRGLELDEVVVVDVGCRFGLAVTWCGFGSAKLRVSRSFESHFSFEGGSCGFGAGFGVVMEAFGLEKPCFNACGCG